MKKSRLATLSPLGSITGRPRRSGDSQSPQHGGQGTPKGAKMEPQDSQNGALFGPLLGAKIMQKINLKKTIDF